MTYQELAKQSLDVQDACNLSGVVKAMALGMTVLWAEADRVPGRGTDWVNKHPIVTVFLDKLAQLNGTQHASPIDKYDAYDRVHNIVEGKEVTA